MTEYPRRQFLKFALAGALAAAGDALAEGAAWSEPVGAPSPFTPESVATTASELAKTAFKAPKSTLPDPFPSLSFEQYAAIRRDPGTAIWADGHSPFTLEPLHRGSLFTTPVDLFLVENGAARKLAYVSSVFDFGKLEVPNEIPDIGFSGVRVLKDGMDTAIFQGASFFRSLARGQTYGLSSRGLSIHTGDPQGEEFPFFRSLWIEKPTPASDALIIHALLDSVSLTGAFRFTIRAGEATIIDTELTLFARVGIDRLGLGTMAGTYLFGPLDHLHSDDVRESVHDVGGLQILTGTGEWIWRPVSNRSTLQISGFADHNPRGFGMLQRDRNFDSYADDSSHWERRPSLWIEPIGDWGDGELQLLEIPNESEANNNIIAFWRPKGGIPEGASASFAYRQFWCWAPPAHPDLATALTSRMGKTDKRLRFVIEFVSEAFADPKRAAEVNAAIEAAPGQVTSVKLFPSSERKSIRVDFDVEPGSNSSCELRVVLKAADKPASETWLYRWTA